MIDRNFIQVLAVLEKSGFEQSWFDGGPPYPPTRPDTPLALGRGRVAWFFHNDETGASTGVSVLYDLPSTIWHLKDEDGRSTAKGAGAAQLRFALRKILKGVRS